eukprot:TRINITY_DN17148_c0_g1_i3.p1 TRINITY_DN17148_c0_g1~~TRINITY_DN17148_c0_g1_i3.p1  ORF type:complete len:129 (+),score=15.05 TRINITY_DN17148_c0_g1_i3:168-554(+)
MAKEETKTRTFQEFCDSLKLGPELKKGIAKERLVYPTILQKKLIPIILEGQPRILIKYEDDSGIKAGLFLPFIHKVQSAGCLLYTSDAADDTPCVDLGGRRIIKKKKSPTQLPYTLALTDSLRAHLRR